MNNGSYDYGLWELVAINTALFLIFALSFVRPRTARDWRTFGAFSAFLVALFTEMYGFPLTIYLLSGWLGTLYPGIDLFSHEAGHLWETVLGLPGDPHGNLLHLLADSVIGIGFLILATAWRVLHHAQRTGNLATSGLYRYVRHPQYVGFIAIMLGFLLEWPTLLTIVMFPVLVTMYVRLARWEEQEVAADFGEEYLRYTNATPAFIPRLTVPRPLRRAPKSKPTPTLSD